MLSSVELGSLVTYLAGSALSSEDLKRADAQSALAVFFLSNGIVNEEGAVLDDAANVLRVLSVTNYNSRLKTYAEIITRKDRNVLRNSQVDVVICLDEYRTAIQARNAVCPGISTLIENLFHTFGDIDGGGSAQVAGGPSGNVSSMMGWLDEYIAGAEMEVYYVSLSLKYVQKMGYSWSLMAEGVYLEFGAMLMGVCSSTTNDLLLHPSRVEINQYSQDDFFLTYNTAIVICESYEEGMKISRGLEDDLVINRILSKMTYAEESFKVRTPPPPGSVEQSSQKGTTPMAGQEDSESASEGLMGGIGRLSRGLSFSSTASLRNLTSKLTTTTSSNNNSSSSLLKPMASDAASPAVASSGSGNALLGRIQLSNRENSNNSKKMSSNSEGGGEDHSIKKKQPPVSLRRFSKDWTEFLTSGGTNKTPSASSPSSKVGLASALALKAFANEDDAKEIFIKTLAAYEETSQLAMEDVLAKARISMGSTTDAQSRHERNQHGKSFQGYLVPDEEGGSGVSDFMTDAGNKYPPSSYSLIYPH